MDELYDKAIQEAIAIAVRVFGNHTQTIAAEIKAELTGLFNQPEYKGSVDPADVVDEAFDSERIGVMAEGPVVAVADAVRARYDLDSCLTWRG